ncbi:hypothetical protein [Roseinatronobacter sp. NSM]|uniref:hypothetical protein n=1 Tax=Roseinatronobacter sp. NSM TaxID=3457785 RepID=UPI004036CED8
MAGLSATGARLVEVEAGQFWFRADFSAVEKRILDTALDALEGAADYGGEVKQRMDHLIFLLIRFVSDRIDGQSKRFGYLARIKEADKVPLEDELQEDLYDYLNSILVCDLERIDISSGRTDIYIPCNGFRLIIELKRLAAAWTEAAIAPLLRQTTAYHQTDIRLGVLGILDLSDRPAGVPHLDQCIYVQKREVSGEPNRTAVVMRVPGNARTPSDSKT